MELKTTIYYNDLEYDIHFGVRNISCNFTDGSRFESVHSYDIVNLTATLDGHPVTDPKELELVQGLAEESDEIWDLVEEKLAEEPHYIF